ncbi:uncharacterized protein [Parasteatoda tepidariorum]|uniref:uncharacterized protein n=1 Tax=Parasteatoda tepidariorum TaxID=114398 RepID=UPI001C722E4F|nr:uncharacterized protein LOC122269509 [Parasteatoda tepidariorum]
MIKVFIVFCVCIYVVKGVSIRKELRKLCGDELPAAVALLCRGSTVNDSLIREMKVSKEVAEECCEKACNTERLRSFCEQET